MASSRPPGIDRNAMYKVMSWPVVLRSLVVALVVGTVLNAINQGSDLVAGRSVDGIKLLLTYAVPFFVASYGAYTAFRQVDAADG
jgi:hypothetical protein